MLAGIYYGAQYGGAITSILLNTPGETASAVTCLDGYPMARQGRAGPALAIAALASFFAGCVCTLLIALAGPPLAEWALKFGPAEYFSLMLMALVAAAVLTHGDLRQGARHGRARAAARARRHRRQLRRGALHVRRARAHRRHRLHGDRGGAVRGGGDRGQPGTEGAARGVHRPDHAPDADARRTSRTRSGRRCAGRRSARSSACCRAPGRRCRRSRPTWSRRSSRATRRASARARSKASRRRRRPTTPPRRPRSSPRSRSAFPAARS